MLYGTHPAPNSLASISIQTEVINGYINILCNYIPLGLTIFFYFMLSRTRFNYLQVVKFVPSTVSRYPGNIRDFKNIYTFLH